MPPLSRRRFLQTVSLAALAAGRPKILGEEAAGAGFRNLVPADRRMRIAFVGVGGRGYSDLTGCASLGEEVTALCDVDFDRGQTAFHEYPLAARYRDYRQMLDELHDRIDGVVVATPDHSHFPAALLAMERGKHVYVEKPLAHTIEEARALKQAAANLKVVTQMGNQGHANEGTRAVKEWIEAGVIGNIREVQCWTDRPIWPQGMRLPRAEAPVPPTLDWNLWLGVAPERDYHPEIAPFNWRGYWDYGSGAIGDMACHVMDAPFWALNLRGPVRVSARSEGGSEVIGPRWSIVRYEFPARGGLPPLVLTWYDGGKLPPAPKELGQGYTFSKGGAIYLGSKGTLLNTGAYGESPRLIPESRMRNFVDRPPMTLPRVPHSNQYLEWIAACKGAGPAPGSNFVDHAADLTQFVLLGNVALRAGRPIDWDPVRGQCRQSDANRYLRKNYRVF